MNTAIALNCRVEGKDCAYWLARADCLSQSVHVGVAIVAALATITLIGSLLVMTAQQGCSMGELNELVKYIDPNWVHATVALSAAILLLDIVTIFALINGYTKLVYSKDELEKMSFQLRKTIHPALKNKQYLICSTPETENQKGVYAVISQKENLPAIAAFKKEENMLDYVTWLNSQAYQYAEEEGHWEKKDDIYSIQDMENFVNMELIKRKTAILRKDLKPCFFDYETVYIEKWQEEALLFVAKSKEGTEDKVFLTRFGDATKIGARHLPGFYNIVIVRNIVELSTIQYTPQPLREKNHYQKYEPTFFSHCVFQNDQYELINVPIFVLRQRTRDINAPIEFFLTEKERDERLVELGFLTKEDLDIIQEDIQKLKGLPIERT